MSDTRYASGGLDGWLRVRREGSGDIISLPEYLQVRPVESKDGRDYFTPMKRCMQDGGSRSNRAISTRGARRLEVQRTCGSS